MASWVLGTGSCTILRRLSSASWVSSCPPSRRLFRAATPLQTTLHKGLSLKHSRVPSSEELLDSVKTLGRLLLSTTTMAPISSSLEEQVKSDLKQHKIVIYSKTTCPFCAKVKNCFETLQEPYHAVELDTMGEEGIELQNTLARMTGQKTVPNVFINGNHVGGCDKVLGMNADGTLSQMLSGNLIQYDYDLVVIGGGSGGLAASKEAALQGKKVAVCDFVKPSPMGTTWGLGGTCVNVGCIPKKLMHQAGLLGHGIKDSKAYGWEISGEVKHNWGTLVDAVQEHIKSLNWGYKVDLMEKKVKYLNAYASLEDAHTVKTVDKKGKESKITAANILIAVGGRPRYPNVPGAEEYCITSDDLFSLPYPPGKTLLIGASYISLECAGFLAGLGFKCTVMVRSILLRGFDQQIAEMIGDHMANEGVNFIRGCVPTQVERISEGQPGELKVTGQYSDGEKYEDTFNTVIFAVGRDACTSELGLQNVGVQLNSSNGKVIADEQEKSSVDNIYAIGDVLDGKPELTPVAIQAGRLLAKRMCGKTNLVTDYTNVPTTVFTPLEYGCVGFSEEKALEVYGEEDVEIYHSNFKALENTLPSKLFDDPQIAYAKLICVKSLNERVVGFHYLGPNAGEVTQGFALGLKLGATKADFNNLIGIHPTCAEIFTTLQVTKSSGVDPKEKGC